MGCLSGLGPSTFTQIDFNELRFHRTKSSAVRTRDEIFCTSIPQTGIYPGPWRAQAVAIRGAPHVARRHAAVPRALHLRVALNDWDRNDVHERVRA